LEQHLFILAIAVAVTVAIAIAVRVAVEAAAIAVVVDAVIFAPSDFVGREVIAAVNKSDRYGLV
jgi:hypothetical protein